ncbi:MAG: hypothetical protein WD030_01385, partial [Pirellulales bacterium]
HESEEQLEETEPVAEQPIDSGEDHESEGEQSPAIDEPQQNEPEPTATLSVELPEPQPLSAESVETPGEAEQGEAELGEATESEPQQTDNDTEGGEPATVKEVADETQPPQSPAIQQFTTAVESVVDASFSGFDPLTFGLVSQSEPLALLADDAPLMVEKLVAEVALPPQYLTPEPVTGSGGDVERTAADGQAQSQEAGDDNVQPASAEEAVDEMSLLDRAFEQELWLDFVSGPIAPPRSTPSDVMMPVETAPSTEQPLVDAPLVAEMEQPPVKLVSAVESSERILLAVPLADAADAGPILLAEPLPELNVSRLAADHGSTPLGPLAALAVSLGLIAPSKRRRSFRSPIRS